MPDLEARSLRRSLEPSPSGGDPVYLFTGCVMDAWLRDTHRAAQRVIEAAGGSVKLPHPGADCCGALHLHAGRIEEARSLAARVTAAFPGTEPVLVDSAGCGAVMKDYDRLLDSDAAADFAARVVDVHEWLTRRDIAGLVQTGEPVVVQDPCHLRHVQGAHHAVREVLGRAFVVAETDDEGQCCGAGGVYRTFQPDLAGAIRDRKIAALERAGGADPLVASANPGCMLHLRDAGVRVRHPVEILSSAIQEV